MDVENLSNLPKIGLTNSDKADKIWCKLKEKAHSMGYGTLSCVVIVRENQIVEIRLRPSEIEECIRA